MADPYWGLSNSFRNGSFLLYISVNQSFGHLYLHMAEAASEQGIATLI